MVDQEGRVRVTEAWRRRRSTQAIRAVERTLRAMASGIERCMYCEDSAGADIEHFFPKVSYPESTFVWANLLWICPTCNRQKSDAFDPAMLDPTVEDPLEHLILSLGGRYTPRNDSPRGSATLRVLPRLKSDPTLTRGRQNALMKLRGLLQDHHVLQAEGRVADADEIRRVVVEEPFSAVFAALLHAAAEPGASDVLGEDLVALVSGHPEMRHWLDEADQARMAAARAEVDAIARGVRVREVSRR